MSTLQQNWRKGNTGREGDGGQGVGRRNGPNNVCTYEQRKKRKKTLTCRYMWCWIVNYDLGMNWIGNPLDWKSTGLEILLDLFNGKSCRSTDQKSSLNHKNITSQPFTHFPDLSQLQPQNSLDEGEEAVFL
jgi:hypothetical protein